MNNNGLSLLEVLIAMIILSLGILGMAPMVVMSIEGNNTSQDILAVSSMAKEKLEYYESLETLPALPFTEEATDMNGYTVQTYLRDDLTDTSIPAGVCQCDITITWTDKSGVDRSTTYSTLLSKG